MTHSVSNFDFSAENAPAKWQELIREEAERQRLAWINLAAYDKQSNYSDKVGLVLTWHQAQQC